MEEEGPGWTGKGGRVEVKGQVWGGEGGFVGRFDRIDR